MLKPGMKVKLAIGTSKASNGKTYYKAFNPDMTCRNFQYKEGEWQRISDKPVLCESGVHACEEPLDVLLYYPLSEPTIYHEVELKNVIADDYPDTSKVVASDIKVGKLLSLEELIAKQNEDNRHTISNEHCSISHTMYKQGFAVTTNDHSISCVSNFDSAAICLGRYSIASSSYMNGQAYTQRMYSISATTGYESRAVAKSSGSVAVTTGYESRAVATGRGSIAIAYGKYSIAKGALGSYILCTEWDEGENIDVQVAKVDGVTIKPDTYYILVDGKFVEVEEEE